MDPEYLHSFLKAYECGSIQKASALLNLSQPSLSRRLQRLEHILDVKLFERTPQGLVPTVYGNALAARARVIDTEMALARREIEHIRSSAGGWVTFGVNPGVAGSLMPRVADDLRRHNPDLRLTVMEGVSETLIDAVREGKLEFAICTAPVAPGEDAMMFQHITDDPFVIACAADHPLARRDDVTLEEVTQYPWAMATFTGFVRQWFESAFLAIGLSPPVASIETSSMVFLKQLLQNHPYLSFLPAGLLEQDFPDVSSVRCKPPFRMIRSIAVAHLRHRELSPAAQLVIAGFQRNFGQDSR